MTKKLVNGVLPTLNLPKKSHATATNPRPYRSIVKDDLNSSTISIPTSSTTSIPKTSASQSGDVSLGSHFNIAVNDPPTSTNNDSIDFNISVVNEIPSLDPDSDSDSCQLVGVSVSQR